MSEIKIPKILLEIEEHNWKMIIILQNSTAVVK